MKQYKIMFVCHGNICRSPMAEFVLKDMVKSKNLSDFFEIDSSATSLEEIGRDTHLGTKRKLDEVNIKYTPRQAKRITLKDYKYYDYIIAMDQNNIRNLNRIIGSDHMQKVSLLLDFANLHENIADPWYTGNFDETYSDIKTGCTALLNNLLN